MAAADDRDDRRPPCRMRYGWTIVAVLAVTETVSWGVLYYAFAVFLPSMRRSLGWSKTELTGAFSLALQHRRSLPSRSLVLAWSQVDDLLLFYLVWVGVGLAMACVLYEAAFTVVTKWFHERRRQALTAVTLVGGFASFVFSPLSNWLIDMQGWRHALITLAVVLAAATVPLHGFFLRPAPRRTHVETPALVPGDLPAPIAEPTVAAGVAVASSTFWYLTAAFVLSSFAISAVAVHLIPYLREGGRGAGFAAFAAGLMGLMQVPGRVVFAGAGKFLPRRYEAACSSQSRSSAWATAWRRSSERQRSPTPTAQRSMAASPASPPPAPPGRPRWRPLPPPRSTPPAPLGRGR
jgi:MFS family permease